MKRLHLPAVLLAVLSSAGWLNASLAATLQTGSGSEARVFQFEPRVADGPGDLHGETLGRITVLLPDGQAVYAEHESCKTAL